MAISEGRAQIADWPKVLHDVANGQDRPSQAGAEKLISETLLPTLQTESAQILEKDVASVGTLLDDKDPQVRFKASALLWAVTMLRQDTTEPLKGILPALLSHFHDPDTRVRANVARAVAGLRPSIPPEALRELLPLVHDTDRTVQDVAIYGITRSVPQSPEARKALLEVLSEGDVAVKADALKDVGFVRLQDSAIIEKLRQLLSDKDRSVVLAAIVALDYAGPAAAPARPELQKMAAGDGADRELAKAAAAALASIDRH
ncbi:MAG TPA: HEAT repeat domain-containing protein [Bryobacteraceae bacterium]|nr:HEAT repeat domain-containing protein [Bryobacteraceae bacterium]